MCSRWKFEICWRVSMSNIKKYTFESELAAPWELFIKLCSSLVIKMLCSRHLCIQNISNYPIGSQNLERGGGCTASMFTVHRTAVWSIVAKNKEIQSVRTEPECGQKSKISGAVNGEVVRDVRKTPATHETQLPQLTMLLQACL